MFAKNKIQWENVKKVLMLDNTDGVDLEKHPDWKTVRLGTQKELGVPFPDKHYFELTTEEKIKQSDWYRKKGQEAMHHIGIRSNVHNGETWNTDRDVFVGRSIDRSLRTNNKEGS